MEENIVVQKIEHIAGTDVIRFISGKIDNCGNNDCTLSDCAGSVYGIAVKLETEEIKTSFIDALRKDASHLKDPSFDFSRWTSIGDGFYPLYWGKDVHMGSRLYAHTREMKSTGTIQLCNIGCLNDKTVIYGAVPCLNRKEIEKRLHKKYPDVLKTITGKLDTICIKDTLEE